MNKVLLFLSALLMTVSSVAANPPRKIIFDTDMGNDVDDIVALDMLYKYVDEGTIDLLGIVSSKREVASVRFIDIMGTMHGHPDIPLGIAKIYPEETEIPTNSRLNFADYVVARNEYPHTITDYDAVEDGYVLLRRLLAGNGDNKDITVIAVGFSTNLARLLNSGPDKISPLSGKELVARNVEKLVIMAGNFQQPKKEYNIYKDRRAATVVCEEWPSPMLFSDFEIGYRIMFPYTAVYESYGFVEPHPAVKAFEYYGQMPYNRPMWDPTAVLFAIEPSSKYFSLSPKGYVMVNPDCITYFTEDRKSNRQYFITSDKQRMATLRRIVELTTRLPKNIQK